MKITNKHRKYEIFIPMKKFIKISRNSFVVFRLYKIIFLKENIYQYFLKIFKKTFIKLFEMAFMRLFI